MEGLTPVQISELVTLLEDAISSRTARQEQALAGEGPGSYNAWRIEIDHLEAELAWIQWMRENYPDHEETGFPTAAVEEHIRGMDEGIQSWQAKRAEAEANYNQSLETSIQVVREILDLFHRVRG